MNHRKLLFLYRLPWEHREFLEGDGISIQCSDREILIQCRGALLRAVEAIAPTLRDVSNTLDVALRVEAMPSPTLNE